MGLVTRHREQTVRYAADLAGKNVWCMTDKNKQPAITMAWVELHQAAHSRYLAAMRR